jgi:hypothetical protein
MPDAGYLMPDSLLKNYKVVSLHILWFLVSGLWSLINTVTQFLLYIV